MSQRYQASGQRQEARKFGAHQFFLGRDEKRLHSFDFILSTVNADIDATMLGMLLRPKASSALSALPPSDINSPSDF